ncbi:PDZ domain-containing protein [Pseudoalteromonas sp. G4]|uniref:PDZ domain-containing protein n=1 Tax=Pseudoalteromonas sp. G4 TaxID=2992761 RepID=UPI00237DC55F|nr:PDZ domain-containing protein [Pseudoalteromonas sp. G4]MDE3271838.1 PDZ domain-containing protein [Pseudoalteromonas sp. G4]
MKINKPIILLLSTLSVFATDTKSYAAETTTTVLNELPRSSLLGVMHNQSADNPGVTLEHVVANSTASLLGLKVGDVITKVNGIRINDFQALLSAVRPLKSGDDIRISFLRDKKALTVSNKMQPRPYETSDYAHVEYSAVSYEGNSLRSIVHVPKQLNPSQKAPAIFFIQGYTCDSIDYGMLPNITTRQMIDQYTQAGYVVYRIEKPGLGDSISEKPCRDIDFTTESKAFLQGLNALKTHKQVDPENVFLFGHSLGVLHAPVIAKQSPVKGIIGYGGVLKRWYDYMVDIYLKQSVTHFNLSERRARKNTELATPFLNLWLNTETPWQKIVNDERVKKAMAANLLEINGELSVNRHYSFFRDLNRYDFNKLWQEIDTPVLMMHGSLDIQAIEPNWAFDIAKLSGKEQSKGLLIDKAEHAFMRFDSKEAYLDARQSRQYNPTDPKELFDPRIGEHTLSWLSKFKSSQTTTI